MDEKLSTILAELRRRFEAFYGERLVQMVLFGSRARGDAKPDSDVDVLIVLRAPVNPGEEITRTGELTAAFCLQYDIVISRIFMSVEQFSSEQSPLLLTRLWPF